ncbi:hypothetical protein ACIBKX_13580 [Streptomyces sp. NPDC050658]|uniref:hypothetical protein n=1 Tax=unclassified Streptomyces TaxID=2593676 RepID=UPI0034154028
MSALHTTPRTSADVHELHTPLGEVSLHIPTDWFDLLVDGAGEGRVAVRVEQLVAMAYADRRPEIQAAVAGTFHAARRLFSGSGSLVGCGSLVSCGLITLETVEEDGSVIWQVCAGVVDASPVGSDSHAGDVLARHLGAELDGQEVYAESFPAAMGSGVGLVSQPGVRASGEVDTFPEPDAAADDRYVTRLGMAAALARPTDGGPGLLVVGHSFNPEQVASLASLVALICGKSTVREVGGAVVRG